MQQGRVLRNKVPIGTISKNNGEYTFTYSQEYLNAEDARAISISLPLDEVHTSKVLFPFFFNMLAEGSAKRMQCRSLKIDEIDHFTRLLKTTSGDTIGSITVQEIIS